MRLALLAPLAILLSAQNPEFDVQSRLVMIPVTVTDAKGHFVDDPEAANFLVLDNGRPQRASVDTFATGVAPIALVIGVQTSGISAPVLAKVQKIGAMIQPLITGERGYAALITFDDRVRWRQEFTSDVDALARSFQALQPGEEKSARMLDAAHEAIERLRKRPNVRRVLLLISESRDRGSESEIDSVVIAAQAGGVSVYASTYSAFKTAFTTKASKADSRAEPLGPRARLPIPPPEQRLDILGGLGELARLGKTKDTEVLTNATGGATFPFTRQRGLEDAIALLGSELHNQYVLSFTPVDPQPGYHRLEVRCPGNPKLRIRARPAYWSTAMTQGAGR